MTNNPLQILQEAREFAGKVLKNEFPANLAYHSYQHTAEVVATVHEIGEAMGVSAEQMEVMVLAAWFHDLGYKKGKAGHEEESCRVALGFLKNKDYPPEKAREVAGCIMATQMPQCPKNLLGEILCDADLAHLGGNEYLKRAELLRQEMEATSDRELDQVTWLGITKDFVEQHTFFTEYARNKFGKQQKRNIEIVKSELKKARMEEDGEAAMVQEISELKQKVKKAEGAGKSSKKRPVRGIETMFRLTSKNHIDLSAMADTKANIMISINAIILSVVVSLLIRKLEEYPHLTIPGLILTAVCLITIVFAILATRPNIPKGKFSKQDVENRKVNLLFFGSFHKTNAQDYEMGMREMMEDSDYLYSSLIRDIYELGKVLGKKYRLLHICYTIFMFGFVISIISFVIAQTFFAAPYPY